MCDSYSECDVPTGNSWYQEFLFLLVVSEPESEQIGTGKNLVPEKVWDPVSVNLVLENVLEPISEIFGTGKKYWYRHQKYLVPEISMGIV